MTADEALWPAAADDGTGTSDAPAFELPAELAIDTDVARRIIGEFIRAQLRQAGSEKAVLGLSGGIDSALTLAVAVDALGRGRVRAVMLPSRYNAPISLEDSREMAGLLGVRYDEIPIEGRYSAGVVACDERKHLVR